MDIRNIRIDEFNYPLPDERIAKHPLAERDACKLLVYRDSDRSIVDERFSNVASYLPQGSMLVYNNTRVINARLRFRKGGTGALIEIFCLEPEMPRDYALSFQTTATCSWICFVGNSKRWKSEPLSMDVPMADGGVVTLTATRGEQVGNAFVVEFNWSSQGTGAVTFATLLDAIGEIPIPPYLNRPTEDSDREDYQTIYSHIEGSVAAPTAGLHFTPEVLADVDRHGITRRELTLHVGAGTFQPVKSATIGDHAMHTEFISVERSLLCDMIAHNGAVIAVGTTSVRTLESLYYIGVMLHENPDAKQLTVPQWMPYEREYTLGVKDALQAIVDHIDSRGVSRYVGDTRIMIAPGYKFRVVDGMVTNFHQPQSTLLLLVSAFTQGNWREIYDHALASDYRFLSYGDASLLLR